MELTKRIITDRITYKDGAESLMRIKLIDIRTTNNIVSSGEVRIDNSDNSFDGVFIKDDEIKIEIGLGIDDPSSVRKIFTGNIESIIDDSLIILNLIGSGNKLKTQTYKSSLNITDNNAVFRNILDSSSMEYEIDNLTRRPLHSYIMPEAPISEHLQRAIVFLGADFIPWVNREGKLIVKTYENNLKQTDIIFELDEVEKFENDIIETIVDTEVDIFNLIRVGGLDYVVTEHRFILDDRKSKSFISVQEA